MLVLTCPNCGARNVGEFRFGGEYRPRPAEPAQASDEEWVDYLYQRDNARGPQREWWYHRAGCGLWFMAERHTHTNQVLRTYPWPGPAAGGA